MSGTLVSVTADSFASEVLEQELPVIVDFWAPWCGPCKMITPILEEIAAQRQESLRVVKLNVDEAQQIAAEYSVRSIPTLMLFVKGSLVKTKVGAVSKSQLLAWIDESLG